MKHVEFLKRTLAAALTAAMVFGAMTVPAAAAEIGIADDTTNYSDDTAIEVSDPFEEEENVEAADVSVSDTEEESLAGDGSEYCDDGQVTLTIGKQGYTKVDLNDEIGTRTAVLKIFRKKEEGEDSQLHKWTYKFKDSQCDVLWLFIDEDKKGWESRKTYHYIVKEDGTYYSTLEIDGKTYKSNEFVYTEPSNKLGTASNFRVSEQGDWGRYIYFDDVEGNKAYEFDEWYGEKNFNFWTGGNDGARGYCLDNGYNYFGPGEWTIRIRAISDDINATGVGDWAEFKYEMTERVLAKGVTLAPTSAELIYDKESSEGETAELTAKVSPDNATMTGVDWKSSNEKVITFDKDKQGNAIVNVNADGSVTAVAKAVGTGSATVSVTTRDGSKKTASCKISVKEGKIVKPIPLTGLDIENKNIELGVLEGDDIRLIKTPEDANDKITFTSSDPETVSVSETGHVTGLKVGEATVTAKGGEFTANCTVTVKARLASLQLDKTSILLKTGKTETVKAVAGPEGAKADFAWTAQLSEGGDASEYVTVTPANDGSEVKLKALKSGKVVLKVTATDKEKSELKKDAEATVTIIASDLDNTTDDADKKEEKLAEAEKTEETKNKKLWIDGLKSSYPYAGLPVEPDVVVYYGDTRLRLGRDYSIKYGNNKSVTTTASITVTGKGNYSGSVVQNFTISEGPDVSDSAVSLKGAKVAKIAAQTYTGSAIEITGLNVTLKNNAVVDLTKCNVAYSKNLDAGTATVFITGNGTDYKDSVKSTFKINPVDISTGEAVKIDCSDAAYRPGGAVPEVTVTYTDSNGKAWTLINGVDYKLKFTGNKAVGATATVTVTGQGNFKGNKPATFKVTAGELSDLTASIADVAFKAGKKGIAYLGKVKVLDADGKALKAGKDYAITQYFDATAGIVITAKSTVAELKDVKAGDIIVVTIQEGTSKTYTGTLQATYALSGAAVKDLAKMTADKIADQSYTGSPVTCDDKIVLHDGTKTLEQGTDYEIACYINNTNKGTATVLLEGKGDYSGTKTATFKIVAAKTTSDTYLGFWDDETGDFRATR